MKILNSEKEDYHVHSLNFSDGMNIVDEIVRFAGELGLKKIVFADHSQIGNEREGRPFISYRSLVQRWKNVYNDVEVVFGVEADLLNEKGDICDDIQGIKGDFIILSYHKNVYRGDKQKLTQAFINAIEQYHEIIDMIGHIYLDCENIDIIKVVEVANKHKIALELNCRYLREKGDVDALKLMLSKAEQIYITSDAHTLYELKVLMKQGFKFLKEQGF